jgi:uncharacterized protein YegP (UPF0339 family)
MAKFTLYTDKNNDFRWKFLASNDQVVARSSEAFRNRDDCVRSLELLKKDIGGSTVDPEVQVSQSKGMPPRVSAPAPVPALVPAAVSAPAVGAPGVHLAK